MNEYNYVRSENLELYSLEFLAVIFLIGSFFAYRKKGVFFIFALSIPFTDQVYRIFGFSISDLISIYLIIFFWKNIYRRMFYVLPFLLLFLIGVLICVQIYGDFVAIFYGIKFIFAFLIFLIFSDKLKIIKYKENFIFGYKFIFVFSIVFVILQTILWIMGYKIAGVFYLDGIIRVKGLAHEPATFACWIALSFPILFENKSDKIIFNNKLIFLYVVGLFLTSSATALLVTVFIFAVTIFYLSRYYKKLFYNVIFILMLFIPVFVYILGDKINEQALPKIERYIVEMSGGSSDNESGRSGDKILFQYLNESPIIGIGMFRSTRVGDPDADAENYISATNFYITTLAEWGFIIGSLLLFCFISWIFLLKNYINKSNFIWYASIVGWMVMVAGIRVISFYQPWVNVAFFMSLRTVKEGLHKKNSGATGVVA